MTFLVKDWSKVKLYWAVATNWLVSDWKDILKKSYSFWLAVVVTIMLHASDLIYKFTGIDTNPVAWTWLITFGLFGIALGRVVKQPEKNKWRRRFIIFVVTSVVAIIAIPAMASEGSEYERYDAVAAQLIARWEGKRNIGYLDTIARPPLATDCYGHTKTAVVGQYKSDAICLQQLTEEVVEYREGLYLHLNWYTKSYRLNENRNAAYVSLAYNIGKRAAGKSTAVRRLNRGDIKGGCNAISWWNKAGGRVVRGLVRRRSAERQYCLRG